MPYDTRKNLEERLERLASRIERLPQAAQNKLAGDLDHQVRRAKLRAVSTLKPPESPQERILSLISRLSLKDSYELMQKLSELKVAGKK